MNRKRIKYLERMEEKAVSQIMYMRAGKLDATMACIMEIDMLFSNASVAECKCEWAPADNKIAPGAEMCIRCETVRIPL